MNFEISKLIRHLGITIHYVNDQRLAPYGITMQQAGLLGAIAHGLEHKAEITRRYLEELTELKGPTITGLLKKLEENGFIVRGTSPADGRAMNIAMTEKGSTMLSTFSTLLGTGEQRLLSGLTEIEKGLLKDLLLKVRQNIIIPPGSVQPPDDGTDPRRMLPPNDGTDPRRR